MTFLSRVLLHAEREPDASAYVFLRDGESDAVTLTRAGLHDAASRIARLLRDRLQPGDRVILVHPPGPELVAALLGCFYAGVIAVPAYPPDPARLARSLPRFRTIVRQSGAKLLCATAEVCALLPAIADEQTPPLLATDTGTAELAPWSPTPHATAFLQYTSGSTGDPKGVVIGHDNIAANLALIQHGVQQGEGSVGVLWLPPYHDMGLMNTLFALAEGFPCVAMSPLHFLLRPVRWLRAITRYGGTYSGGPNFAYDLCLRRVRDEDMGDLDLRSWRLAFNGAEPIRAATLRRFAERFADVGFRLESHYPCYGLAEATVAVTGVDAGAPLVTAMHEGVEYVGVGHTNGPHRVRIVDPETGALRAEGEVGEIWFTGPSVAHGYFEQPSAAFDARLADDTHRYLRTGDLGFVSGDDLFVCGRLKDVVIVHGKKYHAADLERSIERSHAALRPGCVAALGIELDGTERLVVLAERTRDAEDDADAVIAAITKSVAEDHGLVVHSVQLHAAGTLPKTSSGKLQRFLCKRLFLGTVAS